MSAPVMEADKSMAASRITDELLFAYYHATHETDMVEHISADRRTVEAAESFVGKNMDDAISGLLKRIRRQPAFAEAMCQYETDTAYRRAADSFWLYKGHMDSLADAQRRIDRWDIAPDRIHGYQSAVSNAQFFLQTCQDILPRHREEMHLRIESVRRALPSRHDYRRRPF